MHDVHRNAKYRDTKQGAENGHADDDDVRRIIG